MICHFKFFGIGSLSWFMLLKFELEVNFSERISTETNNPLEMVIVLCYI